MTSDADVRRPVAAWLWGGGLIVASGLLPALSPGVIELRAVTEWAAWMLFAAAMVILAFGLRGAGSIVARRVTGITALLVLGFAPPLTALLIAAQVETTDEWLLQVAAYLPLVVSAAAALVAVAEIARARVVPDPWRWAPAVGLAVAVAVFVLGQLVGLSAGVDGSQDLAAVLTVGGWVTGLIVPAALGIALMLLGARGVAAPPAQIYPSTD